MSNDYYRIDSHKLHFHPARVAAWAAGKDDWETAKAIYPLYVEVSPCGSCNHACHFCGVDYILEENRHTRKFPQLDADIMADRFMEMGRLGIRSVMFAGEGEPLLHKRINELVLSAKIAGIDTAFTTNAVLLGDTLDLSTMEHISWIKASVNAGTEDTYAAVHRTKKSDFNRVLNNLAKAAAYRNTKGYACTIGAQMVVLEENAHEAGRLARVCRDIGLDYLVLKPYSQHKFSINRIDAKYGDCPIVPEEFNTDTFKVVWREETAKTTEISYDKCQATPFMWAYLMASGDLYSCSAYLLDDRFNLGNLNAHTFREVWEGEKRRANWEYVRTTLDIHECRVNCRLDKANRYLTELANGVPHVNFI